MCNICKGPESIKLEGDAIEHWRNIDSTALIMDNSIMFSIESDHSVRDIRIPIEYCPICGTKIDKV